MIEVHLGMVWRVRADGVTRDFDANLLTILGVLAETGKLTAAASAAGITPRHARNLVNHWGDFLGAPLVVGRQGLGTQLTAFGERVLWAGRRVQSRLAPELEGLANDLARALNRSERSPESALIIHASHDFVVSVLREQLVADEIVVDLQSRGSFDALASLRRGDCIVAGFHVVEGRLNGLMSRRYAEGLAGANVRLIPLATRRQGLIVARGNPKRIDRIADLGRADVRMINRQRGSGTRALLEFLLNDARVDRKTLVGYETEELTHSAVAALVAGKLADVGLGLEAAAVRFNLGFVPIASERYYLAIDAKSLQRADVQALRRVVASRPFRERVDAMPGYRTLAPADLSVADALGRTETV